MDLIVLGSSSAGNGYVLTNGKESLIIEAGEPLLKAKKALQFNLKTVQGLIFTHEHGDHSKYVLQYAEAGINCYSSEGTISALKSSSHRYKTLKINEFNQIGSFKVYVFPTVHDAKQPVGFVIHHEETGWTLFLTDTHFSKQVFSGLSNIIVEANYCEKIVAQRVQSFNLPLFLANRVFSSHLEINTTIEFLKATDLKQVNNIVLIHLSDKNSDAAEFQKRVSSEVGKKTFVASAGDIINFNKLVF